MSAAHTPGPWIHYTESVDPNWHIVTTANRMRILANVHIEPGNAVDEANARLITAAPELLEALKEVVRISDRKHDAWDKAHAAIAKATGGAS